MMTYENKKFDTSASLEQLCLVEIIAQKTHSPPRLRRRPRRRVLQPMTQYTTSLALLSSVLLIYSSTALPLSSGQFPTIYVNRTQVLERLVADKVSVSPFVVGGSDAVLGEYPWVAAIIGTDADNQITTLCTGVLIRPLWILSARSCVVDDIGNLVNVGLSTFIGWSSFSEDSTTDTFTFEGQTYSPEFQTFLTYAAFPAGTVDLVILELSEASALPHLDTPAQPTAASLGIVTGWGEVDETGTLNADVLQVLEDVPILSNTECSSYEASYDLSFHLCAGFESGGACTFDYGAPFLVANASAKHGFDLIGTLVAHPVPCGDTSAPDLYSDLVFVKDIVESVVGPPTTQPVAPPTPVSNPSECACSCTCTNGFDYEYAHQIYDDNCS